LALNVTARNVYRAPALFFFCVRLAASLGSDSRPNCGIW
jgi:hypothetical protein